METKNAQKEYLLLLSWAYQTGLKGQVRDLFTQHFQRQTALRISQKY